MTSISKTLGKVLGVARVAGEARWFIFKKSRFFFVYLFLVDETGCFLLAIKTEPEGVERSPIQ